MYFVWFIVCDSVCVRVCMIVLGWAVYKGGVCLQGSGIECVNVWTPFVWLSCFHNLYWLRAVLRSVQDFKCYLLNKLSSATSGNKYES